MVDPDEISPGINHNGAFRLCVQFGQFVAKFEDGSCDSVPRKYDEWIVNYLQCSLDCLQKEFASRVKWGRGQEAVVSEFDKSSGQETILEDDVCLVRAFSERWNERRLFLFVEVVDKSRPMVSNSAITDASEVVASNGIVDNAAATCSNNQTISASNVASHMNPPVDWDTLQIVAIEEDQIGSVVPVVGEDELYAHIGLRAEDERAETENLVAETPVVHVDTEGAAIPIDDLIPGEGSLFYDKEDPPMLVGMTYASMNEFRLVVRQHAIKGQFEVGTQKSDTERFRAYCTAKGCP